MEESAIKKRQELYTACRELKQRGETSKLVDMYKRYANSLDYYDQHIPHLWIYRLELKLGNRKEALAHWEKFAEGCSAPRAALEHKGIGGLYLEMNNKEKAIEFFELALKNYPKIGVQKKLEELKKL